MSANRLTESVRGEVAQIVEQFNREVLRSAEVRYVPKFRGDYLYLHRADARRQSPGPICRLKYTGRMDAWEFAIYKYSDEQYDADEWLFPGAQHVDGTVEGAMRAGLEAYPP